MVRELNRIQINSIVEHINLNMANIKIYAGRIEASIKKLGGRKEQIIQTFQSDLKVLVEQHEEGKRQ